MLIFSKVILLVIQNILVQATLRHNCKQEYFLKLIFSSPYHYKAYAKKNLKSFKNSLKLRKFNFSTVWLSETWCESLDSTKNSNYMLHAYKCYHQTRDGPKGGRHCIFYVTHDLMK